VAKLKTDQLMKTMRRYLIPAFVVTMPLSALAATIPVKDLPAGKSVDFNADVLPFLSDNCISCHSKSTRKAGLNLETPKDILKGGDSGASVVPGKGAESLLLKVSNHEEEDTAMPPKDNKVKAKNLTPEQLGILKRWIDEGAKEGRAFVRELKWQPLPAHLRAILAVATTQDGRFVACSRGNQIFVYDTATGVQVFRGEAHADQVQSLSFSPDGKFLVSGGFREMKVWKRESGAPVRVTGLPVGMSAVDASGAWIATAGEGGVKVRASGKGDEDLKTVPFAGAVSRMAWSDDGTMLAIAGSDKKLVLWNRKESQVLAGIDLPQVANAIVWSADGKAVLTAGGDAVVRQYDGVSGAVGLERKGHPAEAMSLARSGDRVVVGCKDGSVWVWQGVAEQPTVKAKVASAAVAVAVSPAGGRIAAGLVDGAFVLMDGAGKVVGTGKGDPDAVAAWEAGFRRQEISDFDVAYRKEQLAEAEKLSNSAKERVKKATEALPNRVKELEAKTKALTDAQPGLVPAEKALADADVAFKDSEKALQKAESEHKASEEVSSKLKGDASAAKEAVDEAVKKVADLAKGVEAAKAVVKAKETALKAATDALETAKKKVMTAKTDVERGENAKKLAESEIELAKTEEKTTAEAAVKAKADLTAQEAEKAKVVAEVEALKKATEVASAVAAIHFSGEQGWLVIGHANGLVQVRGAVNAGLVAAFGVRKEKAVVHSVRITDSRVLVSAEDGIGWSYPTESKWVLTKTIGSVKAVEPFKDRVLASAFSRDGELLAVGGGDPSRDGDVLIWKTRALDAAPRRAAAVHSDTVLSLAFSPDGRKLVTGGADKTARVVDVESLKVERTLEGHTHHVLGVAWSPDGRGIVTGGGDNAVKIWDALTGVRKKNVDGVEKEITSVQYLGSGGQFVAASGDGKVRVIGSASGTAAKTMADGTDFVHALATPASGRSVFAGGQDGVLRVWNPTEGVKVTEFRETP
jgi:WD40 repeat protein